MVIGNSVGGWIAAEMALRDNKGRIGALTLLNAVGIHAHMVENRVVDPRTMAPADDQPTLLRQGRVPPRLHLLHRRPASRDRGQPADPRDLRRRPLHLRPEAPRPPPPRERPRPGRLGRGGRHSPLKYGRGYADAFPDGHFAPIPDAAHFPQIEALGATLEAIGNFVNTVVKPPRRTDTTPAARQRPGSSTWASLPYPAVATYRYQSAPQTPTTTKETTVPPKQLAPEQQNLAMESTRSSPRPCASSASGHRSCTLAGRPGPCTSTRRKSPHGTTQEPAPNDHSFPS